MTINGFRKAYDMTSMQLGHMVAPKTLAKAATIIQSQFTSCAGSVSQVTGPAALTHVEESDIERNVGIMW